MSVKVYSFAVTGMHCASCGILIDEAVEEDVPGVERSETSVRTGRTTVHADEAVSPQHIIDVIVHVGYQAELEAAQ